MFWFLVFLIVIVGIFLAGAKSKANAENKRLFHEALQGDDKAKALALGRKYYSGIRSDGKLTVYDEQALTNDLATMQNTILSRI